MMKKAPEFLTYEMTRDELLEELEVVISKRTNEELFLDVMDWGDGDFTISVREYLSSEEALEKVNEAYGETEGGGLTDGLLEDLFQIKTGFHDIKSHQEDGTYYISVRLSAVSRYKEAWAQVDAIQEALDCLVADESNAVELHDVLKERALAASKLIGDLVPKDMSGYEPAEHPEQLTNEKGELLIK